MTRRLLPALLLALLAGCSSLPPEPGDGPGEPIADPGAIPDAEPRSEPKSRYGNPERYEVFGRTYQVLDSADGYRERGIASWYGSKFHGRRTSSGEPFDMYAMTAAHRALPLPTYVAVRHLESGREIVVRVNDRGPFADNRIIDLSYAAAAKLGMLESGTAPVEVRTVTPDRQAAASGAGSEHDTETGEDVTANAAEAIAADPAPAQPEAAEAVSYFLQVGAFREAGNARRLADRLQADAFRADVRVESGDDGFHRVQLGPLTDIAAVDRISDRLAEAGHGPGHVVIPD
ncbi:septal ring lytic transglycosylase RlpA family protein [Sediminicurvatus halobius]|uniref:Endolytic peptidoglycan transglycosylase RlpA n=1 Tax=Sediminicurvatus halobius TaxID=2182432 RepID=A0A2U2N7X7_9GAMM|nr:septal ring lytic transglycosylase RlpA family protein [Spiribacter halobius]PWG65240.1 septal ring lytic transglycosylase RlpA family lipoprotein [Spiribacter halobius]UEX78804.1 septal ring lytic transglycosylase RlpA family protein [Spiribacter halobius]